MRETGRADRCRLVDVRRRGVRHRGAHRGLAPNMRPAEAPTITTATAPGADAWHGISKPTPASVDQFMRDQGNWYTPFTVPGMPGPYDIRGWHASRPAAGKR